MSVDYVLGEVAKHSFVVAVMLLLFMGIIYLLFKMVSAKLESIKAESVQHAENIKVQLDKDIVKVDQKIDKTNGEMKGIGDKIHELSKNMVNNNHNTNMMGKKLDLILVKLGGDPIKMAQELE